MVFYVENENCLKVRITKPQSRKNLRQLATQIRAKLGIDSKQLYVDILFCLEILIPKIDSSFQYKIFDPGEFEKPNEAFYSPENNCIFIRSDVYNKARDEDGRARFTIAHEIKHVLYCEKDPSQKDEELANHFARALLAPSCLLFDYIDNQNAAEVADRFGISNPAAKNALTALNSRVGAMGTQLKQYEIEYLNYINSYNLTN